MKRGWQTVLRSRMVRLGPYEDKIVLEGRDCIRGPRAWVDGRRLGSFTFRTSGRMAASCIASLCAG